MHGEKHFLSKRRMIERIYTACPLGAKNLNDSYETIP